MKILENYIPEPKPGETCLFTDNEKHYKNNLGSFRILDDGTRAEDGYLWRFCRPVRLAPEPTYWQDDKGNIYATIDCCGLPWVEDGQEGWFSDGPEPEIHKIFEGILFIDRGKIKQKQATRYWFYFTWLIEPAKETEKQRQLRELKQRSAELNEQIQRLEANIF